MGDIAKGAGAIPEVTLRISAFCCFLSKGKKACTIRIGPIRLICANIMVVKDVPISRHPEDFYDDYDEDYWDD